jgi:hypothetical protein
VIDTNKNTYKEYGKTHTRITKGFGVPKGNPTKTFKVLPARTGNKFYITSW